MAREIAGAARRGRLDLLYVSPERLLMPGTLERLRAGGSSPCSPSTRRIASAPGATSSAPNTAGLAQLAQRFPGVPRIALTATADPRTRADILAALDMPDAAVFTASFHRANLNIAAAAKQGETAELLELVASTRSQAGIVYCGSRNKTERIAERLRGRGRAGDRRSMPACRRWRSAWR